MAKKQQGVVQVGMWSWFPLRGRVPARALVAAALIAAALALSATVFTVARVSGWG